MRARQPHTSLRARESLEICLTTTTSLSPPKRKDGSAKARSDPQAFIIVSLYSWKYMHHHGTDQLQPFANRQSVKNLFKKRRQKSILALEGLNTSSSVWKQTNKKKSHLLCDFFCLDSHEKSHLGQRRKKKILLCGGSMQRYNVQGTVFSVRRQQQRKSSDVNNCCGEKTNHNQWQL